MATAPRYEPFEHTADIGIHIFGGDLVELFSNAAFALYDCMVATEGIGLREQRDIALNAENVEDLLHNWLNEHLYLFSASSLILPHIVVHAVSPTTIQATAHGELYDPGKNRLKTEIKAVTYHQFSVAQTSDTWSAKVIFDV